MKPVVLMRASLAEQGELDVARKYFMVLAHRAGLSSPPIQAWAGGSPMLVVPRYSALPYYAEFEADVVALGGQLINSHRQHAYVADLAAWYDDFRDLTPRTWFRASDVPMDEPGPFVLKGATNSRKGQWSTHMFAPNRAAVGEVLLRLLDDPLISTQGVYVRQFEPFVSFGVGVGGAPVTKEYRFFILDGEILAAGFYWSEHYDELVSRSPGQVLAVPTEFVRTSVCPRLAGRIRFVVADVAQHQDGRWRLVELNDGSMSGLGMVDPDVLYSALWEQLAGSGAAEPASAPASSPSGPSNSSTD